MMDGSSHGTVIWTTQKPMTNAEKIRQMTDEELAAWIVQKAMGYGFDGYGDYVEAWTKWLKQEAKE